MGHATISSICSCRVELSRARCTTESAAYQRFDFASQCRHLGARNKLCNDSCTCSCAALGLVCDRQNLQLLLTLFEGVGTTGLARVPVSTTGCWCAGESLRFLLYDDRVDATPEASQPACEAVTMVMDSRHVALYDAQAICVGRRLIVPANDCYFDVSAPAICIPRYPSTHQLGSPPVTPICTGQSFLEAACALHDNRGHGRVEWCVCVSAD